MIPIQNIFILLNFFNKLSYDRKQIIFQSYVKFTLVYRESARFILNLGFVKAMRSKTDKVLLNMPGARPLRVECMVLKR